MFSLISAVAVHAVGINHQFELFSLTLQGVDELKGVLEMHVVVSRAVSQPQKGLYIRNGRKFIVR